MCCGTNPAATNDAKLRVRGWEVALGWNNRAGDVNYWVNALLQSYVLWCLTMREPTDGQQVW